MAGIVQVSVEYIFELRVYLLVVTSIGGTAVDRGFDFSLLGCEKPTDSEFVLHLTLPCFDIEQPVLTKANICD